MIVIEPHSADRVSTSVLCFKSTLFDAANLSWRRFPSTTPDMTLSYLQKCLVFSIHSHRHHMPITNHFTDGSLSAAFRVSFTLIKLTIIRSETQKVQAFGFRASGTLKEQSDGPETTIFFAWSLTLYITKPDRRVWYGIWFLCTTPWSTLPLLQFRNRTAFPVGHIQ